MPINRDYGNRIKPDIFQDTVTIKGDKKVINWGKVITNLTKIAEVKFRRILHFFKTLRLESNATVSEKILGDLTELKGKVKEFSSKKSESAGLKAIQGVVKLIREDLQFAIEQAGKLSDQDPKIKKGEIGQEIKDLEKLLVSLENEASKQFEERTKPSQHETQQTSPSLSSKVQSDRIIEASAHELQMEPKTQEEISISQEEIDHEYLAVIERRNKKEILNPSSVTAFGSQIP
jgi:hypothetical protein